MSLHEQEDNADAKNSVSARREVRVMGVSLSVQERDAGRRMPQVPERCDQLLSNWPKQPDSIKQDEARHLVALADARLKLDALLLKQAGHVLVTFGLVHQHGVAQQLFLAGVALRVKSSPLFKV